MLGVKGILYFEMEAKGGSQGGTAERRGPQLVEGDRRCARPAARAGPRKGFRDIEIRKLSGYPPAQTRVEAPLIQSAIGVIRKYGIVRASRPASPAAPPTTCSPTG